jgi:hypothetical protein
MFQIDAKFMDGGYDPTIDLYHDRVGATLFRTRMRHLGQLSHGRCANQRPVPLVMLKVRAAHQKADLLGPVLLP